MDALARASESGVEERYRRVLEIGNELLQHPPSSKEELLEKLDAMGLFSNTKESNFPKTSNEQHKRKNSPSQKEALGSVSITKESNFPKTSKEQPKRKNSLSQEEALGSVSITKQSNLPKTSKEQCKRKNSPSQEKALGSVSNTKESNFPEACKEQHKRKNLPSQEEALGPVSIIKKSNFPETSKEKRKRMNSSSQEEALGSVSITKQSDFPKTSKEQCKRKNSPSREEESTDKVDREHSEELIGCRVRVWWPLDQVFYEGHVTSFDHSEKKHTVIYEDGEEEILNLTKEHWELVEEEDNASDPIQEIASGPSDFSDMPLRCIIDSYRSIRKKKKIQETVPGPSDLSDM